MRAFPIVLLVLWTSTPLHACSLGQTISETAKVCKLDYGKYVGVKQENLPDSSDLCFYTPEIGDCLKSVDFLCYGNCGQEPIISIQHERDDVFHDDYDRRLRIINFRMMPPDDKKDDAFVIRLYDYTVVWLMNGSCYSNASVRYEIWEPRLYVLADLYLTATTDSFAFTALVYNTEAGSFPSDTIVIPSPSSTHHTVPTPDNKSAALGAGEIAGIALGTIGFIIIGIVAVCVIILILVFIKKNLHKLNQVAST